MKIDRQDVYEKYEGHCAYCGKEIDYKDMEIDHIFPQARNHWIARSNSEHKDIPKHIDDFDNLNPACRVCNRFKGVCGIELFRKELQSQAERANRYSCNYRMAKKYGLIIEIDKEVKFYFEGVNDELL